MTCIFKPIVAIVFAIFLCNSNVLVCQETRLTRYTYTQENSFWLDMIDRDTILTFRPGIIRDYDKRMDDEYWIDHNSYSPSILDDSHFVESENGFRSWAGSINTSRFFTEANFKIFHQIEEHVFIKANFTREENYASEHDILLVSLGRNGLGSQKINLYGEVSLETDKDDFDLTLGISWDPIDNLKLDFQFTSLDFLNNLLNKGGGISSNQLAEKRIFDSQPYAFRLRSSYEWNQFRVELFGAIDTPEKASITFENNEFDDFTEEIQYGYWGGKIEKQWQDNFTTGIFWHMRFAEHIREGTSENSYYIEEYHAEIGIYGMYNLNERWRFESEAYYSKIDFKREKSQDLDDLDTDDWGLTLKSTVFMRVKSKWQAQAGLILDRREMTTLVEKYPLDNTNIRLAMGFRYQFKDNFYIMFTTNVGIENFYSYDGSSIQIQYLW